MPKRFLRDRNLNIRAIIEHLAYNKCYHRFGSKVQKREVGIYYKILGHDELSKKIVQQGSKID